MDSAETILTNIFTINTKRNKEAQIIEKMKHLLDLEISFSYLENKCYQLENVSKNDKLIDYIDKLIKKDNSLDIKDLSDIVNKVKTNSEKAKQILEKLKNLNPLVSILSENCQNNKDIDDLIVKINELQNEFCHVKKIIEIEQEQANESIKKLFGMENAFKLPSNVFYRLTLKKLFKSNEIHDSNILLAKIEGIKNEAISKFTINEIKKLQIEEFKDEIIQKTQDLMKTQEDKMSINKSKVSSLVYQRIESNYLEFSNLTDDDKLFLQTTVARIMHFDDFKQLGSFCDRYFNSEIFQPDEIKCFLDLFKSEDSLIQKFRNFGKTRYLNGMVSEIGSYNWPKFDEMGIEVQHASQFFTFWHCITQLISLKLDNERYESILLPSISKFLKDTNMYDQFSYKMQKAYIEPTIQNYYVIFESLMKLLNASGVAKPESNFEIVSRNASVFFQENQSDFFKISNGIDTLLNNENKITNLFSTERANVVIEEYDFVKKVDEEQLFWQISFNNHIRLMSQDNQVAADFVKLRLIAAKLNIVMIVTENKTNSEEFKKSAKFVKFFQTAETLYDKLTILHELNFDIGNKEITNESLDSTKIEELINSLEKIIQSIDDNFSLIYKDNICILTKEQFFSLYQLINRYKKNSEKSLNLVSILEGTITSSYVSKTKSPIDDYYKLFKDEFDSIEFKDEFESFEFNDNFSDENIKAFDKNLSVFGEILSKVLSTLIESFRKNFDGYSMNLQATGSLDDYLSGGTVRCINCNNIMNTESKKVVVSSKYQLHSMILYLLRSFKSTGALPFPTQLLICSMEITLSQIDSFLGYFNSMTEKSEKCMFIIVSPIQLQPSLYDYLVTKLREINEKIVSTSRIVILFEDDDLKKKQSFREFIRYINVDSFKPITNTEHLTNLYKINGLYGIQAYYIYERFPRTGKTHTILKHIHEKYPDHIYTRILVDESTTLPTIIKRLNEIRKIDNKGKSIVIHFNVDGKCNTDFHLYIQNLAFFRSLNDGVSIPFLANNKMVFYFEFGSRPSYDKYKFIQNVFPIADYIEEIKIPERTEEFFTYDEYHTITHNEIKNALRVIKRVNYRKYLIEAATISRLDKDPKSFLKVDKSALHVSYADYIDYYLRMYNELEKDPKSAYDYLLRMFKDTRKINEINDVPNEFKVPLISQISDVSKIIAKFKGPILSQATYGIEASVGCNIRRFLVGLIIEAAINNCGLPYMTLFQNGKLIESTENDETRLKRIQEFIKRGHMLAVCDPAGDQESQSFTLICNNTQDFDDLLIQFDYHYQEEEQSNKAREAIKSALNVIDSEWQKAQDSPDVLFSIFANILNLQKYEENKYNIAIIVNTWRSMNDESHEKLNQLWNQLIDDYKKKVRDQNSKDRIPEISQIYNNDCQEEEFLRQKRFWIDVQDQIIKQSPFDISIVENKQSNENKVFVSNDVYTFISNCEKYIQNEESLMLKYTLTPQNIMRFIHLVYRIYSHVPIVLMGETGSGKTFTLNFLSEIIGSNVQLIRRVIDGGTKEENLRAFLRANIDKLSAERSKILKDKLRDIVNDSATPTSLVDLIKTLPIEENNNEILTNFEQIYKKIKTHIEGLSLADLGKYDIRKEDQRSAFINYVLFNLYKFYQDIEKCQKSYLFFFDEVNTAPCQWFIKEIILDRYFEGEILPDYIHFVCAVNPSRKLNETFGRNSLDALELSEDFQDDKKDLVYKVGLMPESFVPYLFPADPNRKFGSYAFSDKVKKPEEYLYDVNINSEFDVSIDKKVESEFSLMTYPYAPRVKENAGEKKEGDKHHFSLTDMFSTSFDFPFFNKLTNDPKKALKTSRIISRILSRINIFCCRLLYHEIYKDESFSSIRDPERCIQIMRWAYKFGIYEKLRPDLTFEQSIERLRKAFIIGLSVSFWIRLSDQKQKGGSESHRKIFIDSVCKFWTKVLDSMEIDSQLRNLFKAPVNEKKNSEWKDIIKEECLNYIDLFVDDDECVSKNEALKENIWVAYICIMNNIPLWIIGKPGTSKSLAINIVINKLMNQNSRSEKILKCPPIVQQTFMCSTTTKTEAILDQLGKIVDRSNMYEDDNYVIRIQVLEEIGHADMSRFKPLVCLHNIIDNGYPVRPDFTVPVQLIGLSNYKMDSAKLNRGILLLRCSLDGKTIKQTAFDIFKSTNLALNPDAVEGTEKFNDLGKHKEKIEQIGEGYQEVYSYSDDSLEKPFIGLRDFYGLIQSLTEPIVSELSNSRSNPLPPNIESRILTIIRRNFSGIPYSTDDLNNNRTSELILKTMDKIFPDAKLDEDNSFKTLLCPIELKDTKDEDDIEKTTVYYNMTKLIQANINQEHRLLKTPIFRHILISTVNAAAISILVQNGVLQFTNYNEDSPYELFFAHNMSNLPDAEWISNELRRLTEIMYNGGKTAIFIGKHPCFDCLYDIFNLRYRKEGGGDDENFVATISYGGDSYATIVNSNFKAIIIVESDVYKALPQPFLNRFEKFNLTYETELLNHHIINSKENVRILKKRLQKDLSLAFGCYSDELLLSIYHILSIPKNANFLDQEDFINLSIHPSELIYSIKNDISYENDEILAALKTNSNLRSSIAHLLHGYKKDYKDISISSFFYRAWKKNKGIKSIVMVPSFNNIDKIPGYDFVRIDSSNSINIDSRIKAEVTSIYQRTKDNKKPEPIVLSILISQGGTTIDQILQYEYTLESIRRWCKEELWTKEEFESKGITIHTLIIISMEHKIENLQINQSIEWPLIYLDTCYDNTIKTKKNSGLPLSLKQLVFTPLKNLVKDKIIDLDDLIQSARNSIYHNYTKEENELIDNLIFNIEGYKKFFILDQIKFLIKGEENENENNEEENENENNEEENVNESTNIESITGQIEDLWSIKKITLLSSTPSSLIEYLSLKLIDALGSVMGIIFEILLSGIHPGDLGNFDKDVFKNGSIFNYMINRDEFTNSFYWIFNSDSTKVYPIDYRYNYNVKLPGQLSFYKYVWQLAFNINDTKKINDYEDFYDNVKNALIRRDENGQVIDIDIDIDELMDDILSSNESSLSFPFIASYLLVVADSVQVDFNHMNNFTFWISSFIKILIKLYKNTLEGTNNIRIKYIMYFLASNKDLMNFAHNFTISFMFFPNKSIDQNLSQSASQANINEFYKKLVSKKIKNDIKPNKLPNEKHIHSEEAYLLSKFISKEFAQTLNKLKIDVIRANNLFRNQFSTLYAIYNSINIDSDDYFLDQNYRYKNEPKYFQFMMTLQKFFIDYGDIISNQIEADIQVDFMIKSLNNYDFSKEDDVVKFIPIFVKDIIDNLNLGNKIDINIATSSLLMYYLETIYNVNIGLIDPYKTNDPQSEEEEEEEEEEAQSPQNDDKIEEEEEAD